MTLYKGEHDLPRCLLSSLVVTRFPPSSSGNLGEIGWLSGVNQVFVQYGAAIGRKEGKSMLSLTKGDTGDTPEPPSVRRLHILGPGPKCFLSHDTGS